MAHKELTIVMDRAGTGKSAWMLQEIARQGTAGRQMLLVPEHASHQAERDLCAVCGDRASRHVSVASFRWLAADVLTRTGGLSGTVLDGGGRILTMYRALQETAGVLKVYRRPSQKAAFLEQLLHLHDELRSYCIDGAELLSHVDTLSRPLGDKVQDIVLICGAYETLLRRDGRDCRDLTERLLEALEQKEGQAYFEGLHVYVDGFLYFNAREEEVLRCIIRSADSVTVSLLGDPARSGGIFDVAQQVRGRLARIAQQEGAACRTILSPLREQALHGGALRHLEQCFFDVLRPYEGETDAVALCRAPTAYDEVEAVAAQIRALAASGKCRYRDILVAARNMQDYEATIENVFERYEIPAFVSRSRDILEKPVIALVLSALDTIAGEWEYEDLFRYLKTGMADIAPEACDALENYVLKWDIRGGMWTREAPWTAHPDGYDAPESDDVRRRLEQINESRRQVRAPLLALQRRMAEHKTARGQVEALYDFLCAINLPGRLQEKTAAFRAMGENKLAEEYTQIWKLLCDVMDQFVFILGDGALEAREFARLLKLVLTQYEIGTIPVALDQVSVAEITRNDRHTYRYVFLLGANDHVLPAAGSGGGLLTDSDRAELLAENVRLAPFGMEQMNMELMHLYAALSQATERLCVSWPCSDLAGTELRPAFVVGRLRRLFPSLKEEGPDEARFYAAAVPALEKAGKPGGALWDYFAQREDTRRVLEAMERGRTLERGRLSPDAVRTLYGEQIRMSASRIDRVNSCHFAFFMQYGLKAKERRKAGLDAPEIGTFLHYLLENTAREAARRGGFRNLEQEELRGLIEGYIDRFARENLGGLEEKSARFRYLFNRLKKTAFSIVENVAEELSVSDFVPLAFELEFGGHGKLPAVTIENSAGALSVSGKVDRVDGWVKDGKLYLRVVDYKTGKKKFDLSEILHGVGVQMLLYLFALEREGRSVLGGGEEIVPAGVEYVPARDAILTMDRGATAQEISAAMEKELRRSGMYLCHPDVLEAMEHGATQSPHFLPLTVKRDGSITEGVATAAQLGKLSRYIDHLLEKIAEELHRGNIDADPNYQSENKNACAFCAFAAACHFEEGRGRDRREYIASVRESAFWEEVDRICAVSEKGGA
ncbi:MAG TPA: exodeoxyribonuclease V subunit gamma [Firmicutes bacterium]|nr:exodeoxyribonuclease V subunit gamma [Bacillota bacterium]